VAYAEPAWQIWLLNESVYGSDSRSQGFKLSHDQSLRLLGTSRNAEYDFLAMNPDSEQERQRLAHLYSGMTPEELQNVAADGGSLTDAAHATLKTEITQRGLAITVNESPASIDVIEERKLVSSRRFRDLPEALLAKGSLDSSGIECFLTDDNMVRMDWFISNLLGGVKLLVNREDAEAATTMLDEPTPQLLDVEGVGEY
jgi:hypothetical protein